MGGDASAAPWRLPTGGYFPGAIWFGRGFLLVLSYVGLPALIPLYPIAGAPALAAGWIAHTVLTKLEWGMTTPCRGLDRGARGAAADDAR
jgi:hypothetical protein